VVSLAIPVGLAVGGLAFRRLLPRGFAFLRQRGLRGFRAGQVIRAGAPAVGLGLAASAATELAVRGTGEAISRLRERNNMAMAPIGRFPQAPVRRGTIVTPGPVPVEFVRTWQACAALFAIDDQGQRWVWRPRLGIWKRIRNTRNIVISGKDLRRAKRLVRISKRLNKMRTQLR